MYDLKPTNKIDYFEFKVIVWHIPRGFKISTIPKIFKFLSKAKFPFSQIHKINRVKEWCKLKLFAVTAFNYEKRSNND